jgi:hypothetical protein
VVFFSFVALTLLSLAFGDSFCFSFGEALFFPWGEAYYLIFGDTFFEIFLDLGEILGDALGIGDFYLDDLSVEFSGFLGEDYLSCFFFAVPPCDF